MSDVEITIKLPEALFERVRAEGMRLDTSSVVAMVETELARLESAKFLFEAMDLLQGTMTEEEIELELASAKAERIAEAENRK